MTIHNGLEPRTISSVRQKGVEHDIELVMAWRESESAHVILTINGGSSSIRFALFRSGEHLVRLAGGKIERIGLPDSRLLLSHPGKVATETHTIVAPRHEACVPVILEWLDRQNTAKPLRAIGHRIVHGGMRYSSPERLTPEVVTELRRLSPYDPEHLPAEIDLIESFMRHDPTLIQIACFDTAFHRDMPSIARLLPIPRRYYDKGVRRYGFHGLSYAFLMKELKRVGRAGECAGRIILAHLGNGASMAAVSKGKPVETTMGFTPTSGLPMSRRSGERTTHF